MVDLTHRLSCRLDGLTSEIREQKRLELLNNLGLLATEVIPVFEEATQTVARFLETPIAFLGLMLPEELWLKSALGLSQIGLMNQLALSRKIPREESFCLYVVDSQQPLSIEDTLKDPVFSSSALIQYYGIRSYLGTPLMTAEGQCIGTLAVMDLVPHQFSSRDLEFLTVAARWCIREFERDYLLQKNQEVILASEIPKTEPTTAKETIINSNFAFELKIKLLAELIQELKTPLTSVVGMASILGREIYGPLNQKQKEYLDIINNSGQHLRSLVEEIVNLDLLDKNKIEPELVAADIEMLCQQVIKSLEQVATQQKQELCLSVEPGNRIWRMDKDRLKQSLYYLILSMLQSSEPSGKVRIHVSRKTSSLNLTVWISHPWLGDGLPQVDSYSSSLAELLGFMDEEEEGAIEPIDSLSQNQGNKVLAYSQLVLAWQKVQKQAKKYNKQTIREILSLLLSCYFAEIQQGQITLQSSAQGSYRYVLKLPKVLVKESREN